MKQQPWTSARQRFAPASFSFSPRPAMPPSSPSLGLSFSIGAVTTVRAWYPLRHFPGPFLASVSNLWLARTSVSGNAMQVHMAVRARYGGPLVRVAPDSMELHSLFCPLLA